MNDKTDKTTDLETLAEQWLDAKRTETLWRDNRIALEEKLIATLGCKDEGSQTHKAGQFKIRITGKMNRRLDEAAWNTIAPKIPEALRPVSYSPKLDTKGLRYLEQNEPDIYRQIAEAIIAKPGKPAVEVK